MMERTDEQKLVQAPIEVTLGGKLYAIRPLVIKDSREWRKKLVKTFAKLPGYVNVTTDNPESFAAAMNGMMVELSDEVTDLFFGYAIDLDREAIEATANDTELADAFQEVVKYAFPLSRSLTKALSEAT